MNVEFEVMFMKLVFKEGGQSSTEYQWFLDASELGVQIYHLAYYTTFLPAVLSKHLPYTTFYMFSDGLDRDTINKDM
jgi:hypothetical protein